MRPDRTALFCGLVFTLLITQARGQASQQQRINAFIDQWHAAATQANATAFFGSMSDSSVYIGTDAKERWSKPDFIAFAKPYFDRGKAWDFKPYDRDIHISDDGEY